MTRKLIALALLFTVAPAGFAQDMPLSQILIDGEGWKKVVGKPTKPEPVDVIKVMGADGVAGLPPLAAVRSASGDTIYVSNRRRPFIWAHTADPKGIVGPPAEYCMPRVGADGSVMVTGLAADKDGRIYALTELGVQVFDPSGRLCGVLTPAAKGYPQHLAFEGDQLTCWFDSTKYTRKLNTTGAK